MTKPTNLKDMLAGGHISRGEVESIARSIFDGKTTMAGPEGYVITASSFDALPEHVRGFIVKAVLEFSVENVLDAVEDDESEEDVDEPED